MKKTIFTVVLIALLSIFMVGCNVKFDPARDITIVARDSASGTREAFEDAIGLRENKVTLLRPGSEELTSTGGVIEKVKADKQAIGYISAGLLNDSIKSVKVNDVAPTVENIKNGTYKIQRPFIVVYQESKITENAIMQDFEKFLRSKQAQELIATQGFVSLSGTVNGKIYGENYAVTSSISTGKLDIEGSTSVGPVMEKLTEKYKSLNPNITLNVTENSSSTGQNSAKDGNCNFGMMSKALSSSVTELVYTQLAIDGVAIIVNKENPVNTLTIEQIKRIYIQDGKGVEIIKTWSQI